MTEICYGIIVPNSTTELYYGVILRQYIMESYYGFMLPNDIEELPCEKDLRDARDVTGGPSGDSADLLGPSQDPPGTPHDPQKQTYLKTNTAPGALDCCMRIPSLQRIIPRTPLDRIVMYTMRTKPLLVGHRVLPGELQAPRTWWTPLGGKGLPIGPPGKNSYICVYIYIYVYTCAHIYIFLYACR